MSLRDVLETYLYTRQWRRDQEAAQFEHLAYTVEAQGIIAGLKGEATKLVRPYRDVAERLRKPELWSEPDREERDKKLTAAQRAFMRRGRDEAAKPLETTPS